MQAEIKSAEITPKTSLNICQKLSVKKDKNWHICHDVPTPATKISMITVK